MSTPLIPVFAGELSGAPAQLVDARLLHIFLESAQEFANWIKNRIEDWGFIENQDYLINLSNRSDGKAGRRRTDYHLSIDMAKQLGMIERNDKGRQIRRYFLDMERMAQTKQNASPPANTEQPQTLDGRILLTIRNGQIISSEPLPESACLFAPDSAPSIRGWIFDYVPARHLGIVIESATERALSITSGMVKQLPKKRK